MGYGSRSVIGGVLLSNSNLVKSKAEWISPHTAPPGSITGEVLNAPGAARKIIIHRDFFGGHEALIPAAACGESPVIRLTAQRDEYCRQR